MSTAAGDDAPTAAPTGCPGTNGPRRDLVPLAAVLLLGAALGCTRISALDLPLAIANGSRILAGDGIPRTNAWVWTNPGFPWLHDKWGFDVLAAAAARAGETAGLAALQIAFGMVMAGVLFALARRVAGGWRAAAIASVGLAMLSFRLTLRAEWISYLGAAATLWLLPGICDRKRFHEIAFLALVPVWAACHAYWFLGPLVVLAAGAGLRSPRTILVGAAGVLAAAVSPYGFDNVFHPIRVGRQLDGSEVSLIVEMHQPFGAETPWAFHHVLGLAIVVGGVVAFAAHARARNWRDALALAVWLPLCCVIERNLALLGVVVPLVAAAPWPAFARRAAPWAGLAGPVLLGGTSLSIGWFAAGREAGLGWQAELFPGQLVADLDPAWSRERYVNDFSTGSFLDLARGSSFIDGNTHGYPPEFLSYYVQVVSGRIAVAQVDQQFPNDGWLLRHNMRPTRGLISSLFAGGEYAPVRADQVATLFKREPDPAAADAAWREWLRRTYLPRASAWWAPAGQVAAALASGPGGAQTAVRLNPWIAAPYAAMAAEFERAGETAHAARARRCAARLAE